MVTDDTTAIAPRPRARALGIELGRLQPGPWNAITDVAGVRVGHTTLIDGEPGPVVVGQGPVRTGVTVILPCDDIQRTPLFAGYHVLNGCGEMTGLVWVEESGFLGSAVALTNTFSVGVVRDALIRHHVGGGLPVVAETWDGVLSDIRGMHVRDDDVARAIARAASGQVAEGNVGGGTGMICHGFKGGIGTSSRVLPDNAGGWTVGALVQANHGQRALLRVDGAPVGRDIPTSEVPAPTDSLWGTLIGPSSIIVVIATDAPLIATQCRRLAQRATLGVARMGGLGENPSGDIFLAFSTANQGAFASQTPGRPVPVQMLANDSLNPLFEAVADATEEAILNALCAATTLAGADGRTAHALPLDRLRESLRRYGRLDG